MTGGTEIRYSAAQSPVKGKYSSQVRDSFANLGGGPNNVNFPDIVNCRHFELPEHYKNELIIEIAKMIGIRLRDDFLTKYSLTQTTNE